MRGIHGALMLAAVVAACGGGTAPASTTGGGGGGGGGGDNTPVATTSVVVGDNLFTPRNAIVAVGATVTWTWSASNGHNVTFDTGNNSATQASGNFQRAFPAVGTFVYNCTQHAGMTGSIIVQ